MSKNETLLTFTNASLKINDKMMISPFSLDIKKGDIILITGPNGCGKSTLIRMILGQESEQIEFSRESVLYHGEEYSKNLSDFSELFSYAEQEVPYNIAISGMGACTAYLRSSYNSIDGKYKDYVRNLYTEYFKRNDDDKCSLLKKKLRHMSGGEKEKINLIRCLSRNSELYFLDEPLNNLDTLTIKQFLEYIRLHQESTFVIVTHCHLFDKSLRDDQTQFRPYVIRNNELVYDETYCSHTDCLGLHDFKL